MTRSTSWLLVVLFGLLSGTASGAEPQVETVVEGLNHPFGLAIQPETGVVFVADSGRGKVVRVKDGKTHDVITGFAREAFGPGPTYDFGPLSLAFVDQETLVVGTGGLPRGEDQVAIYTLPEPDQPALTADKTKLPPLVLSKLMDAPAEGDFWGLAVTGKAIYATSAADATQGSVAKSEINGTKFGDLKRFIASKSHGGPVAITLSPHGELVVSQIGKLDTAADSIITFFSAKSGERLLTLPTKLHDISGLAYSPNGQLYAVDLAWNDSARGGLYQLIAQREGTKLSLTAKPIVALEKPSALAFAKDGTLYITTLGAGPNSGKLLKIAPGL